MASIQAILTLQILLCKGWFILAATLQADDPSCFCIWGEWGPWSTCTRNGRQSRARSINEEESCNGLACTGTPPREYIQCTRDSCLDFPDKTTLPHPTSCTKYFTCLKHNLVEQDCPHGMQWNARLKRCDWQSDCDSNKKIQIVRQPSVEVQSCVEADGCWVRYNFEYDNVWNDCHGDQYIHKTQYDIGKYVGIILCSENRYKLFLSDSIDDEFLNIADGAGHGEDHCEFLGAEADDRLEVSPETWVSPSAFGYFRYRYGETPATGKIGMGLLDGSEFTGKDFVKWYECGIDIPGNRTVVNYTPTSDFKFIVPPVNQTARTGYQLVLECTASKDAGYVWLKNGQMMITDEDAEIQVLPDGLVIIGRFSEEDVGVYTCRATDVKSGTMIEATAWIQQEKPSCFINLDQQPTDETLRVGERLIYRCLSEDHGSGVHIEWKKDGNPITPSIRVSVSDTSLVISRVTKSDEGRYTCKATQTDGPRADDVCSSEITAFLTVTGEDDMNLICGRPMFDLSPIPIVRGKIIDGQDVRKGSIPWQVMLKESGLLVCGGVLIDKEWILTAAHCFSEFKELKGKELGVENLDIYLGKHDIGVQEWHEQQKTAIDIITHPLFNSSTYDNDIALIQLETPASITDYVRPICIVDDIFLNTRFLSRSKPMGKASGWGALYNPDGNSKVRPRHLQEVDLPVQDMNTCKESTKWPVTDNMFCAGFSRAIADTCDGDSGGPFAMKDGDRWYLVGLVSWGHPTCWEKGKYGFYTRVTKYKDWIREQIEESTF